MADGAPVPGVRFTFLDYVALGFILVGGEEFLRRGKDGWTIWVPGFALGLVALAFRDRSPQFTAWFLGWFRAPKKLAVALAENAELKKQLDEAKSATTQTASPVSKLVIHRAVYAVGQPTEELVTAKLNSVPRDGVAIKIDATLGGLLPNDPAFGVRKRLEVDYSYGSDTICHVSRTEPPAGEVMRLVLPEDTEVQRLSTLLSPLQIEALSIAKELRDFYASLGPYPSDPTQNLGEDNAQYLVRVYGVRTEQQRAWERKLSHGFANRKFGERLAALIHRAGEEFNLEYSALLSSSAGIGPPLSAEGIPRLAQEVEMIAIWINRKMRNEGDLLHPES